MEEYISKSKLPALLLSGWPVDYMKGYNDCRLEIGSLPAEDVRSVVLCKDCIHAPFPGEENAGLDLKFPDDECPCKCIDGWYSHRPEPDWFCGNGKKNDNEAP